VEKDTLDGFYKLFGQATSAKRTIGELVRRSPSEAQTYINDPEKRILISIEPALRKLAEQFSDIRRAREIASGQGESIGKIGEAEQKLLKETRKILFAFDSLREQAANPKVTRERVNALYERYQQMVEGGK
jgi:hypothetical protein